MVGARAVSGRGPAGHACLLRALRTIYSARHGALKQPPQWHNQDLAFCFNYTPPCEHTYSMLVL